MLSQSEAVGLEHGTAKMRLSVEFPSLSISINTHFSINICTCTTNRHTQQLLTTSKCFERDTMECTCDQIAMRSLSSSTSRSVRSSCFSSSKSEGLGGI